MLHILGHNFSHRTDLSAYICDIGTFANGEIRVTLPTLPDHTSDIYIHHTIVTANDIISLGCICDQLIYMGYTNIHLISPYLAYTRQDRRTPQHASFTLQVLVGILAGFGIASLTTVDIHSQTIHTLAGFPVYELDPSDTYISYIQSRHTIDPSTRCVVAPDAGARHRANIYSSKLSLPCIVCHKTRSEDGKISSLTRDDDRDIAGKSLLIVDDMIDTGGTLAALITQLHTQGASHIYCLATHGIFSGPAYQILDTLHQDGILDTLYISDSHPQRSVREYIEVIGL